MHRATTTRFLAAAIAILLPSLTLASKPIVQIKPGHNGSATILVKNAYRTENAKGALAPRTLRMKVPLGVARKLAAAAGKGGIQVSTQCDIKGPMLRVIAGQGKEAVVVGRYGRAGANGQNGAEGVRTVQFGLESNAPAFYVGATRSATRVVLGTRFKGNSTVTRYGLSTFIDPATLKPVSGKADGNLRWYLKPVSKRLQRTTDPRKPLAGFNQLSFYEARDGVLEVRPTSAQRVVTAAQATLVDELAKSL